MQLSAHSLVLAVLLLAGAQHAAALNTRYPKFIYNDVQLNNYEFSINESYIDPDTQQIVGGSGRYVGDVTAYDPDLCTAQDAPCGGGVTFTVFHTGQSLFKIEPLGPQQATIRQNAPFLEGDNGSPFFALTVRCCDSGEPVFCAETIALIRYLDVNDNAPIFDKTIYNRNVFENVMVGEVVEQVYAKDIDVRSDFNEVSYAITQSTPAGAPFAIQSASGRIYTTVP
jgi:hypothetical protein